MLVSSVRGNFTELFFIQVTGLLYKRPATEVKIADDISFFKTIHKSKGDEFDNVLVVIPTINDNKSLEFLLAPK
ncbi:hypothetical protein FQP34_09405 [Peribacillus simplex]|uniref:UvrD-like helicase C-terminal domain-containing protein n=1 Tax=Peribacillus simplex TaxID=1478 RepID=A0A8B5XZP2_9BACI|nr:hypothetical protein [Peribacillus simplex]MED3910880.1 hypothetical protein [Peribacillus simplex]TVX81192.1 hypothetical protein FQP34_09405 [Peribacillus simplex]